MTARQSVDAIRVGTGDPRMPQQEMRVVKGQVAEREAAKQQAESTRPARHRSLPTSENDTDPVADGRNEGLSHPRVERSKQLGEDGLKRRQVGVDIGEEGEPQT